MKKILSLLLVVSLIFVSGVTSFADTGQTFKTENSVENQMFEIFDLMEADISSVTQTDDGARFFSIKTTDTRTDIKEVQKSNGDVTFTFKQGNKSDDLTVTKNKEMLLDGVPVMVTDSDTNTTYPLKLSSDNVVRGGHRIYWTEDAPYGKESDYKTLSETLKRKVSFGEKAIKNITQDAFFTCIVAALGFEGVGAFFAGAVITTAYDYISRNDPESRACSLKDVKYVHKTKGFNVSSSMSVYYHIITYYANSDYTSPISPKEIGFQVFAY